MKFIRNLALFFSCTSVFALPIDSAKFPAAVRIACVGDSITAGVGASPGHSYPDQLQELLGEHWKVGNFGASGCTLLRKGDYSYWNVKAFTNAQNFQPDVVIILLGTNDTKPQNWLHHDEFAQDYTDLVKIFLALPSKPVVIVCRPTSVPEPGLVGINERGIQQEIPIIDGLAASLKLDVIDMHAALDGKPELLPDHVHPNNAGAFEIAKTAFQALTGKEVSH